MVALVTKKQRAGNVICKLHDGLKTEHNQHI